MNRTTIRRWSLRLLLVLSCFAVFIFVVVVPLLGSLLITNSRFQFRERGPKTPVAVGLAVTPVEFVSQDGISLRGWWNVGNASKPAIIFVHGLNRSRLEMLERAADANRRGYGVLLFDLRNHGESGRAYTTIGIFESRDVCAASQFVEKQATGRAQVVWGVSMGASSAILAAKKCPGFSAIISDSSFLSFRDTIAHHLNLLFRLPAFPIANLIVAITSYRVGFNPEDGDVEAAVRSLNTPILFIAGGADRRMPPALADRMFQAARSPLKQLLVIPHAGHGEAYATDRITYLNSVYGFLGSVRYNACSACPTTRSASPTRSASAVARSPKKGRTINGGS
jgi:pimeloyl-ACP methyl ester carboxylesterase